MTRRGLHVYRICINWCFMHSGLHGPASCRRHVSARGKKTYLQPLWLRYGYIEAKNSFIIYGFNTLILFIFIYIYVHIKTLTSMHALHPPWHRSSHMSAFQFWNVFFEIQKKTENRENLSLQDKNPVSTALVWSLPLPLFPNWRVHTG
jgi:hypothetical protein